MDGDEIDRWNVHFWLTLASVCVAPATFRTAPTTAAQNELEETVAASRIRQNPLESTLPSPTAKSFTLVPCSRFEPARASHRGAYV